MLVITLRKETLEGIPAHGEVRGARAVTVTSPHYLFCRCEAHTGAWLGSPCSCFLKLICSRSPCR